MGSAIVMHRNVDTCSRSLFGYYDKAALNIKKSEINHDRFTIVVAAYTSYRKDSRNALEIYLNT